MQFIIDYYDSQKIDLESVKARRSKNKRWLEKLHMRDTQVTDVDTYIPSLRNAIKGMLWYKMYIMVEGAVGQEKVYTMMICTSPSWIVTEWIQEVDVQWTMEKHIVWTYNGYNVWIFFKEILRLVEATNHRSYQPWQVVRLKKNSYFSKQVRKFMHAWRVRNEFVVEEINLEWDQPELCEISWQLFCNLNRITYAAVRLIATWEIFLVRESELMLLGKTEQEISDLIARESEDEIKKRIKKSAVVYVERKKEELLDEFWSDIKSAADKARAIDALTVESWVDDYYQTFLRWAASIKNHELCESVRSTDNLVIEITTKDIIAKNEEDGTLRYCGKYFIYIDTLRNTVSWSSIYNLASQHAPHPHIGSSWSFCMWAQAAPIVAKWLANLKPWVVFSALIELLWSYSMRNPHIHMIALEEKMSRVPEWVTAKQAWKSAHPDIILAN